MLVAPRAVFLVFYTACLFFSVLLGGVISSFTLAAFKSYDFPHVRSFKSTFV
jgi:hypothetical protein